MSPFVLLILAVLYGAMCFGLGLLGGWILGTFDALPNARVEEKV